ncbi:MAG: flagellar motor switch protein FliM [Alphaproteobacteria bacterium]|nr:flagellar motor switch protein FliM [Alphaproteobacteria bacterium]
MPSTRKLSTEEVNALIEGLDGEDEEKITFEGADDSNVRPFAFGSDDLSLMGDYYALRMINERVARFSRSIFLPMLRIQPRISSFPPEVKSFDEYAANIDGFMSMNVSRMEELRGNMMMVIDPTFISILTNAYYGGKIEGLKNRRSEFTSTEDRLIELITKQLNEVLQDAWNDLTPTTISYQSREINPQFASFVDGSDLVVICSFVVQLPNIDAATFDIIYPLQILKPIASQLRSRVQSDTSYDDETWRERMEKAVLEIPLKVRAKLSEPKLSMKSLLNLKQGDVFPIQIGEGVEILMDEELLFRGEIGDVSGQAAISLTSRITKV